MYSLYFGPDSNLPIRKLGISPLPEMFELVIVGLGTNREMFDECLVGVRRSEDSVTVDVSVEIMC